MKESAVRGALAVVAALTLVASVPASPLLAADGALRLNDREYFETRGLSVLVFSSEYDGMFFDEKTAGIELVHHGVRTATGGAVRLKPTPEQWDQIPKLVKRTVDRQAGTIEVTLRYEDFDFDSRVLVKADGRGVRVGVFLDRPLPERLAGRAGLNLEFLPSAYFERTYLCDGRPGILPLHPSGPVKVLPASTQIRQFAGHSTFDDRGRNEYVEAAPFASGKTLVLAPEDPERRVTIESAEGLALLDGRNVAQNGWFVVRTLLPAKATGKVVEWSIRPNTIDGWKRAPVIAFSQAGYHPAQKKRGVVELDADDTPLGSVSVVEVTAQGDAIVRLQAKVEPWGEYLRYRYATFDFSAIERPGLYFLRYGNERTPTFPISPTAYADIWHQTLDVWLPVQMDHMFVKEAYRVWHGAAHMDDARQAPVDHQHFDGFKMGPSTDTRYAPGEHIPGLNVGGWTDAGDDDIRTVSHSATVVYLAETWELFRPQRDETLVDESGRYVDIHHPDGRPDLLQQIEHGALALVAQHRAFGRAIQDIIAPQLHQYTHLGDWSTQTDGLPYDPALRPFESNGRASGTPDDRWAFTERSAGINYVSSAALAAASRALRGYDDALAAECLAAAQKAWADEHTAPVPGAEPPREAMFRQAAEMGSAFQLLLTTKERLYADRFQELVWPALDRVLGFSVAAAVRAMPYFGPEYRDRLAPYVRRYADEVASLQKQNPYGVPITRGGWAGNETVIRWAMTNYHVHKAFPDVLSRESVLDGLTYVLGRHPASNVSFVSGVGTVSKRIAYGQNRADFAFIAGGVVPGVLVLKPDFPENKEDWPFLWGENEYVIDVCAEYILLANAVDDLLR